MMHRAAARSFAGARLTVLRRSMIQPVAQLPRMFSSDKPPEQPAGAGLPNPMHIMEQIQDTATKVGLPTSLDDAQAKLQELKQTVEEKVPGVAQALQDEAPTRVAEASLPYVSAGAVLMRLQGELTSEQEEKLQQVLPDPVVDAIRRFAPVVPKDPNLALTEAVIARLDGIQAELVQLRSEVAALNKAKDSSSGSA
eukprot:TRINITY_DN18530_c0_g1_i1.p2 TRINITY_DN18530_c0_g1~~TRINITY_DN18530_c0_g1_i1.p2  ORF type:complete len:196 (+),score=54.09 TRINITY_DN18530_c0_g1_i1:84-671(+)